MPKKERARTIVVVNFDRYNPPNKAVNAEVRAGGPLKWVRWETKAHRDADILDMPPEQRWLWPTIVELAGAEPKINGLRVVRMTIAQLAREAHMPERDVEVALDHLWRSGRVRFSTQSAKRVAARHPSATPPPPENGERVATYLRTDVPTDRRTHVPTEDALLSQGRGRLARVDARRIVQDAAARLVVS